MNRVESAGRLDEDADHPPGEEKGDNAEEEVADPLRGGLRSAEVEHLEMVAGA